LFVRLGRQLAGLPEVSQGAHYHFDFPGSTQGLTGKIVRGNIIDIRNQPVEQGTGRALRYTIRKLDKKGELRLSLPTYFAPGDLSANLYGASFSPKIYPGQVLRARLYIPSESPQGIRAALYASSSFTGENLQSVGQQLEPGKWQEFSFKIPGQNGIYITELGAVICHELDQPWNGSIWIDDLDWQGQPDFYFDFKNARNEYGAASGWTYLRGSWRLEDGAYHGSGYGCNESYCGDPSWKDYSLAVRLTPLVGQNHLIAVRVQGALRSYAFGFASNNKVVLYKNDLGYKAVTEASFAWKAGRNYHLYLRCNGNHLLASVENQIVCDWQDEEMAYLSGQIGLVNFKGCHTRYEEVKVQP